MLFWSCFVKIFLSTRSILLRLDFFLEPDTLGINDNRFYYAGFVSSPAWPAQRAPRVCTAEPRGRLLPRLLRGVRKSGQSSAAEGRLQTEASLAPLRARRGRGPRAPEARTCFGEQRRGSAGLAGNAAVGAWEHRHGDTARLPSAE